MSFLRRFVLLVGVLVSGALFGASAEPAAARPRVLVSTDIGGTDFDDFQSMVHVLLYADVLDLEGFVSSPCGGSGRMQHLLQVIDHYAHDYPMLRTYSANYPTPDALRAMSRQGETETAPYAGVRRSTEGSDWIVQCARRDDPRPLHVLIWGGIEDLAQALHDAPDILPKLRVYYIGGPNKKWSPDAYHYIATNHPKLWIIESNSTYYGWFVGGNQTGDLAADAFAEAHAAGRGALGEFFARGIQFDGRKRTSLKMGDTPTVAWLLNGDSTRPSRPGWGGSYVRAWARPYALFERLTTAADQIEHCGILELSLPLGADAPVAPDARMVIENQSLVGYPDGAGNIRFRFCPKETKTYRYTVRGNVPALDGRTGEITVIPPPVTAPLSPDPTHPDWWTDNPSPELIEGPYRGARTINRWREDYLRDFAARLERCARPAPVAVPSKDVASESFLPAFPGAEGFGARSVGGRAGRVIAVTNLDDSGPGSLRAAIDTRGPRTVVFRVSGTIALRSNLSIKNGQITIAGQTAPGDGVALRDYGLGFDGAKDVVVRYLRVRPGAASGRGLDAFGGRGGENIIVDHCSASWSIDECVSFYGPVRNLTVQWCLISESLSLSVHEKGRHGFGGIWGGAGASWHHNLLAHHSSRNPRIAGKASVPQLVDLRNNVIYNWGYNSTYGGDGDVRVNLVNNVYKPGPATRAGVRGRVANPAQGSAPANWWIDGNLVVGSPEVSSDNWLGVHPAPGLAVDELRAPAAFPVAAVNTQPAADAFTSVLEGAGATLPRRDPLDVRIVAETRDGAARFGETFDGGGNGIIDSPLAVGGWPELHAAGAPADSDGDGMADAWEIRFHFDPKNPADGTMDADRDGYTNLEEYLNATDPTVFVDYRS